MEKKYCGRMHELPILTVAVRVRLLVAYRLQGSEWAGVCLVACHLHSSVFSEQWCGDVKDAQGEAEGAVE